jgi:hypothetical protein
MKNNPEDDFLHDVIGDAASPVFRDEMLEGTLRQVRRRKQLRRVNRGLGIATCVITMVAIAGRWLTHRDLGTRVAVSSNPDSLLVRSVPLGAGCFVVTDPRGVDIVATTPAASVTHISNSLQLFRAIGDEELLASLQGKPAVLVRHGPGEAELVFAVSEEQRQFMVH